MDTTQNVSALPVFLSLKDAATLLSISYSTLHQLAHDGKMPARKIGGQWRMLQEDLTSWFRDGYAVPQPYYKNIKLGEIVPVLQTAHRTPNRSAAALTAVLNNRKQFGKT